MYKVVKVKNKFAIIENKTGHILKNSNSEKDLHNLFKLLKSGSGFSGNTPNFLIDNQ